MSSGGAYHPNIGTSNVPKNPVTEDMYKSALVNPRGEKGTMAKKGKSKGGRNANQYGKSRII